MTPTDKLRALLDERGIRHTDFGKGIYDDASTIWSTHDGAFMFKAKEREGVIRVFTCTAGDSVTMTPEQAIAATVGTSTDLSKRLREVHGLHAFAELFGFSWEDDSDWDWHDVACAMADAVDVATVGRSCASCPEMDNPDSYIVHLHRALEVADKGVGTCKLVDNDSGPDMHCTACGGEVDDEYRYFMDSWGYSRCPHCGARIIEEETE